MQNKSENTKVKYVGTFENHLIPDTKELSGIIFKTAAIPKNYKFSNSLEKGAIVKVGDIYDPRDFKNRITMFLIELPTSDYYICSDFNDNYVIEKNECQPLKRMRENSEDFEQIIKLPLKSKKFNDFPIYLRFLRDSKNPNLKTDERVIEQSTGVLAVGYVKIDKLDLFVGYQFNLSEQTINPTSGLLVVDANSDGKFDNFPFSNESAYALEKEVVFRVGDLYLSSETADLIKNQIVMRPRLKSEYMREEFEVGKEINDFPFVDFDNKKRSLSDFRGKYLLMDFWGLWCVDCRREIPYQIAAYKFFRSRGFEILAMDSDEDVEKVKAVLAQAKITWTQARLDSIKELIEVKYGIQQYPSTLLLSPEGKILVLDQEKLKGNELLKTLDAILPK